MAPDTPMVKNTSNSSDVMGKSQNSIFHVQAKAFVLSPKNNASLFKIPNTLKRKSSLHHSIQRAQCL